MPDEQQAPLKIYGWAADHYGCGQYRIGLPMWGLERAGHDARAFTVLEHERVPEDVDVLVGQTVSDDARGTLWREVAERSGRRPVLILEIDDDVWNVHPSNPVNPILRDPATLVRLEENLRLADAVTVTTEQLAERVRRFNPHVYVLPNCVDLALITHQRPRAERLTVGWAGGSSHANDFAATRSNLRQFLRRHPEIDLHLVGQDYRRQFKLPNIRWTGWNRNLVEYLHTLDFDLGIAPLAYTTFNRSKSDLKFLEYAALGIPTVASHFGPYADSIVHGVTGFHVRHPHEWGSYLRLLVEDGQLRAEMGINAKTWAATRTIQGNYWRWELAYRETIARVHGDRLPAVGPAAATRTPATV